MLTWEDPLLLYDRSLTNQKDRLSNQINLTNQDFIIRLVDEKKGRKQWRSCRTSLLEARRSSRVHFDPFPPLVWPATQTRLNLLTLNCDEKSDTSPEAGLLFTVCSDPLSSRQPKWKWSCSSLYTQLPKGPPVSVAVPLGLMIFKVGAWPLLLRSPLTFPSALSQINWSPFRSEFFFTVLVRIFIGDWAVSAQCG